MIGRQPRNTLGPNDGDVIGRIGTDDTERHGTAVGEGHGGLRVLAGQSLVAGQDLIVRPTQSTRRILADRQRR